MKLLLSGFGAGWKMFLSFHVQNWWLMNSRALLWWNQLSWYSKPISSIIQRWESLFASLLWVLTMTCFHYCWCRRLFNESIKQIGNGEAAARALLAALIFFFCTTSLAVFLFITYYIFSSSSIDFCIAVCTDYSIVQVISGRPKSKVFSMFSL